MFCNISVLFPRPIIHTDLAWSWEKFATTIAQLFKKYIVKKTILSRKIFCPMIHAELAWSWEKGRNNEDKVLESTFGITRSHQSNKYENMK